MLSYAPYYVAVLSLRVGNRAFFRASRQPGSRDTYQVCLERCCGS